MAKPFLKFPGGKRGIIKELTSRLPESFRNYFEPFIGGGALYFEIEPKRAIISDINPHLINIYKVIAEQPEDLLRELDSMSYYPDDLDRSEQYFYKLRELDRTEAFETMSDARKASRTIYLNKTCYNGLFRFNSKGQFNAPFGKYKNPKIYDPANIKSCSKILSKSVIKCSSYYSVLKKAKKDDFVYLDPPYIPLNETSSFVGYTATGFCLEEHKRLAWVCGKLDKAGVKFMLSNSNTELSHSLYENFNIEVISAPRAINCNARGRTGSDIIVRNY